jgi:hypothetical protein
MREAAIEVYIDTERRRRLRLVPPSGEERAQLIIEESEDGEGWKQIEISDRIGVEKTIEFAVDFERLGMKEDDEVRFHVAVNKGHIEIERWPRNGYIEFPVPGEDFEAAMWFV